MSESVEGVGAGGAKVQRPEFRNIHVTDLANYRLPLAGFVSILHRISGFMLFLLLPFILYLLEQSLTSEISFVKFRSMLDNWSVKLVILAICWGYLQHFCAGFRHLMMDLHFGLDKDSARNSAVMVLGFSGSLTVLVALKLFGVF